MLQNAVSPAGPTPAPASGARRARAGPGGAGASAVAVRGLGRGRVSRAFTTEDLEVALHTDHAPCVYVDLDAEGWVTCGGGGGAAAVRARLAADLPARTALLEAAPRALSGALGGALGEARCYRLRVEADVAPHEELLLWFHEDVLALLDMPFLTLRNIRGRKDYVCHECGAQFERPNPLKVHMFLACAPYSPARFWRRALPRLRAVLPAPAPAPAPTPTPTPAGPAFDVGPAPEAQLEAEWRAAQLEALAAEWGRGRDGHLCLYCGKVYSRKYGLKIHIRTHTGYRPLRCRHCARAFGDPSNLNKHVRLHAARGPQPGPGPGAGPGPQPGPEGARYSCRTCGRGAARRRDLLRHERAHHPAPPTTTPPTSPTFPTPTAATGPPSPHHEMKIKR